MKYTDSVVINTVMMFALSLSSTAYAQDINNPLYIDLSQTLGFIMGQGFSLNRIKVEYPALKARAQVVEHLFNASFGLAESNIDGVLRNLLEDEYSEYIATLESGIRSTLNSQKINQDMASHFLAEVELRAKGVMPSPILETLLIYQFKGRPQNEFLQGYKTKYRTDGHPKAKGLDLQVEVPISWSFREGNRPNVIQFFSSNNGRGPAYTLIMVRDLTKDAQEFLTLEEINALKNYEGSQGIASELFSESSLMDMAREMGMSNIREITSKRIIMDRWPGAVLEFIGERQRLDIEATMYSRMYFAIYENYLITLQCQIGTLPQETDNELGTLISEYSPLFHLMANSLIIQNQY